MAEDKNVYVEGPKDPRNYIDQIQSRSLDRYGREMTPEEMATSFAVADEDTRVDILQRLAIDDGTLSVREAARRYTYESTLRRTHKLLSKVGR